MKLLRSFHLCALSVWLTIAVAPASADDPVTDCTSMALPVERVEGPPSQYRAYCDRRPNACDMAGPTVIALDEGRRRELSGVNARINRDVVFISDMDNLGLEEHWNLPLDGRGDCEDFALAKREELVQSGWPRGALTLAIAFHKVRCFPHAVLLAETDSGTWVLDNLHDDVLCWDALPYTYSRRERPDGRWTRFRR